MNIFVCAKYYDDARNKESVQKLIVSIFQRGDRPFCMMEDLSQWGKYNPSGEELIQRTFDAIDKCACVVVVSEDLGGTGMGIEIGYAYAKGIPILVTSSGDLPVMLWGVVLGVLAV